MARPSGFDQILAENYILHADHHVMTAAEHETVVKRTADLIAGEKLIAAGRLIHRNHHLAKDIPPDTTFHVGHP